MLATLHDGADGAACLQPGFAAMFAGPSEETEGMGGGNWDHVFPFFRGNAQGMPHPHLGTRLLAVAQAGAWSKALHPHFPPDFKAAVRTLLLAAHCGGRAVAAAVAAGGGGRRMGTRRRARLASSAATTGAAYLGRLEPEVELKIAAQAAFPLSAWDWRRCEEREGPCGQHGRTVAG